MCGACCVVVNLKVETSEGGKEGGRKRERNRELERKIESEQDRRKLQEKKLGECFCSREQKIRKNNEEGAEKNEEVSQIAIYIFKKRRFASPLLLTFLKTFYSFFLKKGLSSDSWCTISKILSPRSILYSTTWVRAHNAQEEKNSYLLT